ncbi:hypothetical protein TNCV_3764541 [Trichonephila clavipes]|uniref:Uncharacterized protein n=1 Tax=Trichonephila clavipes TaxID=2585209 RepID=A0A8X6VVK9_TRICX|nr:hypothetical protein TNCV_3764541 [Trichonephila clavipes]
MGVLLMGLLIAFYDFLLSYVGAPVPQGPHIIDTAATTPLDNRMLHCSQLVEEYLENEDINDEAHFWLNGYINKQNCRIWSEVNPQVYVETPLHPEKLTVWCALWAGGILLRKR